MGIVSSYCVHAEIYLNNYKPLSLQLSFIGGSGHVSFDENGNRPGFSGKLSSTDNKKKIVRQILPVSYSI